MDGHSLPVHRLAPTDSLYDLDVFDFVGALSMRIVRENDEVRQLARCDGAFDGFFVRVVRAVDRVHLQGLIYGDALIGSPGFSIPAGARDHALDAHQRGEGARAEV